MDFVSTMIASAIGCYIALKYFYEKENDVSDKTQDDESDPYKKFEFNKE
jgi:hypothetical protein